MKKSLLVAWMLLSIPLFLFSQTKQVTGTIRDDRGNPLPQASVLERYQQWNAHQ
ncbi:MAG TPA: hypothetical protein VEB42_11160 [Chitinophagaceae bacterium]|nr:hypothetical protein [Chitinophagaceae bacterium]